jgi:hypothetical protein
MSYVCETKSDDLQRNRYFRNMWYLWYFFRGTCGTCGTCGTSMGTSGTSGTRGTSGKQHTDIASHVIHPDPVRNKIRIRCTKICMQDCINLVHNKKPQHLCRGSCHLTTTTIHLLQPQCRHTPLLIALSLSHQ